MRRPRIFRYLGAIVGAALLFATTAGAESPEWNVGVAPGVALTGGPSETISNAWFLGAVRGDVLFGRSRRTDLAFGPALELGTLGFSDARGHAGVSVLLPLGDVLALVATPGGFVRTGSGDPVFGVSGRLFFGFRSLNHYGHYTLAGGLLAGVDRDLESPETHALSLAAQIDGQLLAIPFILLVEWIRGAPE